jgi:hypothetical protein
VKKKTLHKDVKETLSANGMMMIALPNHLSNVNKYFTDETNILHWKNGIFYNEPHITATTLLVILALFSGNQHGKL